MRGASGRRLQGLPDRLGDLVIPDLARPARARLVKKSIHTLFGKAPPPFANRILHGASAMGDGLVLQPLGRQKHDPRPLRQALTRAPSPRQTLQLTPFLRAQLDAAASLPIDPPPSKSEVNRIAQTIRSGH